MTSTHPHLDADYYATGEAPAAEDDSAWASHTAAELRAELDARGIEWPSNAKKADLVALLGE